jgi:hypothetical protein
MYGDDPTSVVKAPAGSESMRSTQVARAWDAVPHNSQAPKRPLIWPLFGICLIFVH